MGVWKDGLQAFSTTALNATGLSVSFLGRFIAKENPQESVSDQKSVWIL
jgi:hypothetical protein